MIPNLQQFKKLEGRKREKETASERYNRNNVCKSPNHFYIFVSHEAAASNKRIETVAKCRVRTTIACFIQA